MIPNKLYIPTSTLNFNNIMSSESISPASFYAKRRFGYKRFEKVAPNNLDNLILLYDKYPIFDINNKELENYPLVIEIDTNYIPEDCVQEKNGVFFSTKSIYINPFSTRIIFRTATERTTSLSKAEPSIESKLIPLYQGQFIVLSSDIEKFDWLPVTVDDLPNYDNNAVSFDIAVNKLKGMLYGYILGANCSSSKEIVSLKRKVKELRNVLSAILASPDGHATYYQEEQLNNLYTDINRKFYTTSGAESHINKIITQKIELYNTPNFTEILRGESLYQAWVQKQLSLINLHYYQIKPFYLSLDTTDKFTELDKYIDNIEIAIRAYNVNIKLDITKLPIVQNRHIVEVPGQKEFLSMLFNGYMNEVWNGTEFLASRCDFATFGGKLFREASGENWENSPARTYINSLRKNLNEYTEFDINSTDSDILKSFAAFCQKGENNIDKLRDYLISNDIGDFRIAFALWGLIFGFAEMPKTLTNDLFERQDEQYLSECYKHIYKQLHAIELDGILNRTSKREEKTTSIWNEEKKIRDKVSGFITDNTEMQTNKRDNTDIPNQSEHRTSTIPKELTLVFESEAFKELPTVAQKYYKQESLSLYQGKIDKTFVDSLKELVFQKTKVKWQNALKPLTQKQKKGKQVIDMPSLFPKEEVRPSNQFFYLDTKAFDCLLPVLPNDKKILKQFQKDLKWFQNNYQNSYFDEKTGNQAEGRYSNQSTDNASVIDHFEKVLIKNTGSNEQWLKNLYVKINIKEVISKLKELYR